MKKRAHQLLMSSCGFHRKRRMHDMESQDFSFKKPTTTSSNSLEVPQVEDVTNTMPNPPHGLFVIEVLKNGCLVERRDVTKSEVTFGRSRDCDFPLDHPSISRNHASVKWVPVSQDGLQGKFFLKDLNSTHGSFVNKTKLTAGQVVRLEVNNSIMKFGGSTRSFLLNSTDASYEEPKDEVKKEDADQEEDDDSEEEQEDLETLYERITMFLQKEIPESKNEHAFSGNPVKCAQDWFEKEGLEFEFEVSHNNNNFRCKINVNIGGRDFPVHSDPQAKKKDSINQACLRSCRLLDAFKLLFPWQSDSNRKRKLFSREDDEDEVLDETTKGMVQEESGLKKNADTYDSLLEKWTDCNQKLLSVKAQLAFMSYKEPSSQSNQTETESVEKDSLDSFMSDLKDNKDSLKTKIEKSRLKLQIKEWEKKQQVYELLIKTAKPNVNLSSAANVTATKIPEKASDTRNDSQQLFKSVTQGKGFDPSIPNPLDDEAETSSQPFVKRLRVDHDIPEREEPAKTQVQQNRLQEKKPSVKTAKTPKARMKDKPDEDFIDWVPPSNQDGSGKTSLNDKLGY